MARFADFSLQPYVRLGYPYCVSFEKNDFKNGEIWKINFRFCQNFTPHYLKTSYGKGTPCSYRVVGKKSETLVMCIGVRFGFVLGSFAPSKKMNTDLNTWSVFLGIFENFEFYTGIFLSSILFKTLK